MPVACVCACVCVVCVFVQSEPAVVELMWSDPAQTDLVSGYEHNDTRGCAYVFGADKVRPQQGCSGGYGPFPSRAVCDGPARARGCGQVEEFRALNRVDLIIRSHEPVTAGFEWFDSGHLVTVFSATNYTGYVHTVVGRFVSDCRGAVHEVLRTVCGRARSNFGAFLLIDNTLKVSVIRRVVSCYVVSYCVLCHGSVGAGVRVEAVLCVWVSDTDGAWLSTVWPGGASDDSPRV